MLIIVIMIKIIGFTSLITKYDEKNEARYTRMREMPTFSFLFRSVMPTNVKWAAWQGQNTHEKT